MRRRGGARKRAVRLQVGRRAWTCWQVCLCSPLPCTLCVSLMPMFSTLSVFSVLLATSLLIPAVSASPVSPYQLPSLQLLLSSLALPWTSPMNEPFLCLPLRPGSPSISPSARHWLSWRAQPPGSLSRNSVCQFLVKSHVQPVLPLLPTGYSPVPAPAVPLSHNPLQSTLLRPSHLQPYSHPAQPQWS